jgi:hypothetical protein
MAEKFLSWCGTLEEIAACYRRVLWHYGVYPLSLAKIAMIHPSLPGRPVRSARIARFRRTPHHDPSPTSSSFGVQFESATMDGNRLNLSLVVIGINRRVARKRLHIEIMSLL